MYRSLSEILGYQIRGVDDEIGVCRDFLLDDQKWAVRYLVVDTNKWLPGGRKTVVSPISLGEPDWKSKQLPVSLTRKGIEESPSLEDHEPVSMQYEREFFNHFGYGFYWVGSEIWGTYTHPAPLNDRGSDKQESESDKQDRHLHSASEILGYRIDAKDEPMGHVHDFILNDENWSIKAIVVDTSNWLPGGRKVIVDAALIRSISCKYQSVAVNQTAEEIKKNPLYEPEQYTDPENESVLQQLQDHLQALFKDR